MLFYEKMLFSIPFTFFILYFYYLLFSSSYLCRRVQHHVPRVCEQQQMMASLSQSVLRLDYFFITLSGAPVEIECNMHVNVRSRATVRVKVRV